MKGFAAEFEALRSVAAACIDEAGALREANAGFLRLLAELPGAAPAVGTNVAAFFIQPDLASLLAAPAGEGDLVHSGLMTLGDPLARTRTLRGRVWRAAGGLRVLAEHDIEELERINQALLDLGHQSVESHLEVGRDNLRLRQRQVQMAEASLTDPLTGTGNRRMLGQALATEIERTQRTGAPLCALMADIDFFKRINDEHGHAAGDKVLVGFAGLLRSEIRPMDVLARYGGEEFVVLLPNTTLAKGAIIANRMRTAISQRTIEPLPRPITASFGVAQLREGEDGAALLERADQALYRAKSGGRNRVEAAAPLPD